ncbi:MAG: hypothetical protein NTZ09_01955, partial [Candidatus Hydrogenedentes bacterium]|nr:hypothetical protein [Candidatus Hydrogenedentota bacterium]
MKLDANLAEKIKREFEACSGLTNLYSELRETKGNVVLIIKVASPTERLFGILEQARQHCAGEDPEIPLATLIRQSGGNLLQGAEGKLLLRTLSESLNINRFTFEKEFLTRYTKSVFGAEEQITASANHIVFGRRGAGKSTLLLYAMHSREPSRHHSVWIDMQVYSRRDDDGVIGDVLRDVLEQTAPFLKDIEAYRKLAAKVQEPGIEEASIRRLLPAIRRMVAPLHAQGGELFIFLDDFHVISQTLQPKLLDILYAVSRGNRIFIKISAIETLTRTFDHATRLGLEVPHDAQS